MAADVMGGQDGAEQMLRATDWARTAGQTDAPLSAGELEEESEDEPVAVPAAVESAVMAGGGPIPQQSGN